VAILKIPYLTACNYEEKEKCHVKMLHMISRGEDKGAQFPPNAVDSPPNMNDAAPKT